VQQRAADELETRKTKENGEIQAQVDQYVTQQRAKIQSNNQEVSREKERLNSWRLKKQQEEKKIAEAVGYFVSENPITTGDVNAPPPPSNTAQHS
jgi:recombination DNA repair RAD52 pathway protein